MNERRRGGDGTGAMTARAWTCGQVGAVAMLELCTVRRHARPDPATRLHRLQPTVEDRFTP